MSRMVIRHATVITMDPGDRVLLDTDVVVEDGVIAEIVEGGGAGTHSIQHQIDAGGGILMPGLINAHSHLAMTLMRGLADDRNLQTFLATVFPVEAAIIDSRSVALGTRLALAESLRAGTTTALDMYWFHEAAAAEARAAGFRLENGPCLIGTDAPDHLTFDQRCQAATATGPHRWIFAHGTYTMTIDELRTVRSLVDDQQARFHIHCSENAAEVEQVTTATGMTPVRLLDELGLLREGTVLAHAVVLDSEEVNRLAATQTAVAHCPLSNMKLGSGIAPIPEMLEAGVVVGLGTDGPASSNDLDLFAAMRMAALLPKGTRGDAAILSAHQILKMATLGGAQALGMDHEIGSIELGKQADLVLLDPQSPSLVPSYDPVSTVVYAASRADVTDVWISGRPVVRDRVVLTIDVPATVADVAAFSARVPREDASHSALP